MRRILNRLFTRALVRKEERHTFRFYDFELFTFSFLAILTLLFIIVILYYH